MADKPDSADQTHFSYPASTENGYRWRPKMNRTALRQRQTDRTMVETRKPDGGGEGVDGYRNGVGSAAAFTPNSRRRPAPIMPPSQSCTVKDRTFTIVAPVGGGLQIPLRPSDRCDRLEAHSQS